jgi:electron transport complex protein RnfG
VLNKLKFFWQQSWLVIVASFCFGLLIAATNAALSEKIEQNRIEKLNRLMSGLLTQAQDFQKAADIRLRSPRGDSYQSAIYKALGSGGNTVGWAFKCSGSGFADEIVLVVALDAEADDFAGFATLKSNETPGFGDRITNDYFQDQFEQAPAEKLELVKSGDPAKKDDEIVAISGATVSSQAVVEIINKAITQLRSKFQEKGLTQNGG